MSVIEIKNLTRNYGSGKGVFNLSFSIDKGEVFGFLGPNGAGKTTTIRHIMGFIAPKQGSCTVNGLDCRKNAAEIQKNLGYIPGEIAFMDEMKGMEFIKFMADYRGLRDMTRAKELIERFELNPAGKLKRMSKGMKQKVGIVCAFMHSPSVIVLDEPTSGLDPLMQNRFIDLINDEKKKGTTVLMSSHIFEEVERTCDRVGIIRQGRLAAVDSITAITAKKRRVFTVTFATAAEAEKFAAGEFKTEAAGENRLNITVGKDINPMLSALAACDVKNIETATQTLEDVFMHYYGGESND